MTTIANVLLVGDCRSYRFLRSLRERQATGRQHFFNTRDNAVEETALAETIPAGYTNLPLRVFGIL
jgi:hypothetical protein